MSVEHTLPRSVLVSLWLEHVKLGPLEIDVATKAIEADDEPHRVVFDDGSTGNLAQLFEQWTTMDRVVAAILPLPGHPSGLAGPHETSIETIDAGEAVLFSSADLRHALVPHIEPFGSHIEPGHFVTWHVLPANDWDLSFYATIGSLRDAETGLRTALKESIERLMVLDVAQWRDDLAIEIERLRGTTHLPDPLPSELSPRRAHLLATGWRLASIADLAHIDQGASITSWEADRRKEALQEVELAARRMVAAATFSAHH